MFYMFFETTIKEKDQNTPIVLWLNGGPRCSSLLGAFVERISPYYVGNDGSMHENQYGWTKVAHLLFVDNPIGVGLSTVDNERSYAVNQKEASDDLYQLLNKFFKLHPEYAKNPFYISGESYAGKYIPNLAQKIIDKQKTPGNVVMVPKALIIGDGLIDPLVQRNIRPEQAYWSGLLSYSQLQQEDALRQQCIRHMQSGRTRERASPCETMRNFLLVSSGAVNIYDIRSYIPSNNKTTLERFINQNSFFSNVHTTRPKGTYITCNPVIYDHMQDDILINVKGMIPSLANHMRIVLFAGNFDLQDGIVGYDQMLLGMEELADSFQKSPRNLWFSSESKLVAGYEQVVDNITLVTLHGSGHYGPQAQPSNTIDMLSRIVNEKPLCLPGEKSSLLYSDLIPAEFRKHLFDKPSGQYILPCEISQLACMHLLKNCNGNGTCVDGRCQCNHDRTGHLCEIKIYEDTDTLFEQPLEPQQWYFIRADELVEPRTRIDIKLSYKPQNTTFVPTYISHSPVSLNNIRDRVCVFVSRSNIPSHHTYDVVQCVDNSNQTVDLGTWINIHSNYSSGNAYIGVLNSKAHPILFDLSYGFQSSYNKYEKLYFIIPLGVLGASFIVMTVCIIISIVRARRKSTDFSQLPQ
ncbi:serine carboxypeptidase S10 family protein [Acrasis kona]|uniref:Carboxypeptidase n=1 Tax=Acrasis kona TaxID=1008807 RepID=A0AAW2ZKX7_9EUKA